MNFDVFAVCFAVLGVALGMLLLNSGLSVYTEYSEGKPLVHDQTVFKGAGVSAVVLSLLYLFTCLFMRNIQRKVFEFLKSLLLPASFFLSSGCLTYLWCINGVRVRDVDVRMVENTPFALAFLLIGVLGVLLLIKAGKKDTKKPLMLIVVGFMLIMACGLLLDSLLEASFI